MVLKAPFKTIFIPIIYWAGFGWDTVNFLHSGWYGNKFGIFAEGTDDNR